MPTVRDRLLATTLLCTALLLGANLLVCSTGLVVLGMYERQIPPAMAALTGTLVGLLGGIVGGLAGVRMANGHHPGQPRTPAGDHEPGGYP